MIIVGWLVLVAAYTSWACWAWTSTRPPRRSPGERALDDIEANP